MQTLSSIELDKGNNSFAISFEEILAIVIIVKMRSDNYLDPDM
jgi:hypothetical protein